MAYISIYYSVILGGTMSYEVLARPLRVAILTVSDTRTFETDKIATRKGLANTS